jgi:hypothetical protein
MVSDKANEALLPVAVLMVLAVMVGFMPLEADPDLWFHLADGERILRDGRVPEADPFSFTRAGQLWVPHAWLFDVGVALSWHRLGPRATEALMALPYMLTFVIAYHLLTARGVTPLLALILCAGLVVAAGNTRGIRPQVISLLFCSVLLWTLVRHRHRPGLLVVGVLPPLFLLWAQVHAACVMGLGVGVVWLVGRVVETLARGRWRQYRWEHAFLAAGLGLSALLVLLTPHAITHYRYVTLTMGLAFLQSQVSEWQAPQALSLAVPDVYQYVLMLGLMSVLAYARRRTGLAELLVAFALLTLGFSAARHIPLACLGAVPLLADLLGSRGDHRPITCSASWNSLGITGAVIVVLLLVMWRFPTGIEARHARVEPVRGVKALEELRTDLRVFTTYNTGSYVLWAGLGRCRVFVDSRADVYGDQLLAEAFEVTCGRGWERAFDAWEVDAAVVERGDPLGAALADRAEWVLLAEDPNAWTFVRSDRLDVARAE